MPTAEAVAGKTLLSPTDHTLILVDFQPQMAFATKSIDGIVLRNNAALVANAAKGFKLSTVLTTVVEKSFSGPVFVEVVTAFPGAKMLEGPVLRLLGFAFSALAYMRMSPAAGILWVSRT